MHWHLKLVKRPKLGERRELLKFAYFPTKVMQKRIWLEPYISVQKYSEVITSDDLGIGVGIICEEWEEVARKHFEPTTQPSADLG